MSKKVRAYHATRVVCDTKFHEKHTILVYGELTQTTHSKGYILAPVTYNKKNLNDVISIDEKYVVLHRDADVRPIRSFNFGWAICDCRDEFDLNKGIRIAKRRFSDSPIETTDVRFLSDDMIAAILNNELDFIEKNLAEKYLPCDNDIEIFVDTEDDSCQETHDECNGECKSEHSNECDGCSGKPIDTKVEEMPNIKVEANVQKSGYKVGHGDFITFNCNGQEVNGIVRSVNNGEVSFYWEFNSIEDNYGFHYSFETNKTRNLRDIHITNVVDKDEVASKKGCNKKFNDVNEKIYRIFGYCWDQEKLKLTYR